MLLIGTGGACFPVVFSFGNEDACVTHCNGVGVLHFCGALSKTIWITHHMDNNYSMRASNDGDTSEPKDLFSLGVVDLDLSISPDAFGLRAFDVSKPLTRMLPGPFPNQLRLLMPDLGIARAGFHDVVIENLADTPTWRSRHLHPGDVTSLRRRWPKAVFRTMRKRLFLSSPGVGVSSQSAGFFIPVSGTGGDCLGHTHDECSSGIKTVVAVPGGMVYCLEGLGE